LIAVRAPQAGDLETIGKDAAEEWVRDRFRNGADFSGLLARPFSNVATVDGYPVAAGGFLDRGEDRAVAWSIVGKVAARDFVGLCRVFRKHIMASPYRWIEAHCMATFHQSHRWVMCLGFEPVTEQCFMPDGREFRKFVFRNERHGA
jgi:hypothetical protein